MTAVLVYITAADRAEAASIGRVLFGERRAACANVLDGLISFYLWQGKTSEDSEAILIAKTAEARVVTLTERVKALHSYDCPCVVTLPIAGGNAAFLDWIAAQTA